MFHIKPNKIMILLPRSDAFSMIFKEFFKYYVVHKVKEKSNDIYYVLNQNEIEIIDTKSKSYSKDVLFNLKKESDFLNLFNDLKPKKIHLFDLPSFELWNAINHKQTQFKDKSHIIYSPLYSVIPDVFMELTNQYFELKQDLEDIVNAGYDKISGMEFLLATTNLMDLVKSFEISKLEFQVIEHSRIVPLFSYLNDFLGLYRYHFNNQFKKILTKSKKTIERLDYFTKKYHIKNRSKHSILLNSSANSKYLILPNLFFDYIASYSKSKRLENLVNDFKQSINFSSNSFAISVVANEKIFQDTISYISLLLRSRDDFKVYYLFYDNTNVNELYGDVLFHDAKDKILLIPLNWQFDEIAKYVRFSDLIVLPITIYQHRDFLIFDLFVNAALALNTPIIASKINHFKHYPFMSFYFPEENYSNLIETIVDFNKNVQQHLKKKEMRYLESSNYIKSHSLSNVIKLFSKLYS